MKSTAVVSQKGGVGKTTVALNLAFSLARSGHRTLLVDADPQGAVGHSLDRVQPSPGLYGVLQGERPREALLSTRIPEFSILPVGAVPAAQTHDFCSRLSDGSALALLLDTLHGDFDLAVIDTPSGFNGATLGALRAADFALSPLQAEPIALRTLPQLLEVVGDLREAGASVQLLGVVLCMLQQRVGESLAVAEEVWSRLPTSLVLDTVIPRDTDALAASSVGVPLGLMSRRRPPPLSLVFDRLAAELLPKLGIDVGSDDEPISLFA